MRSLRSGLLVLVVVIGAALVAVALLADGPATTPSYEVTVPTTDGRPVGSGSGRPASATTEAWADGVVDERDGVVPDGVTVFDDQYPGIANLEADLREALRSAATDAAEDGITFSVHSAWRSPEYQAQLLQDAIAEHGSEEEAARWAAPPDTSLHVTGEAVDIGGTDARLWLEEHGAGYGLCRTYGNEPWHFELFPEAVDAGCPEMYADPTEDPRLQR